MRHRLLFIVASLTILLLQGCFKDNGSYDYLELNPPKWLINLSNDNINIYCRGGEEAHFKGSAYFVWEGSEADIERRKSEVRYEWRFKDKVLSTNLDDVIPTQELLDRLGLKDYPNSGIFGHFVIIEKSSGIEFKAKALLTIYPPIQDGDFVVYAAMPGESNAGKLYSLIVKSETQPDGSKQRVFSFRTKESDKISGTPKDLKVFTSKAVSSMGGMTVITEEGAAHVYTPTRFEKSWDVLEQFSSPPAGDTKFLDRRDQESGSEVESYSWLLSAKGELYSRQSAKNWLMGKFFPDPYYLDEKGYVVRKLGHVLYGINAIPCYDTKNRRVLLATAKNYQYDKNRSYVKALVPRPGYNGLQVHEMPEGTEVFHLTQVNHGGAAGGRAIWYNMYYNDPQGQPRIGTFEIDVYNHDLQSSSIAMHRGVALSPEYRFDKETVFLTTANARRGGQKYRYELFSKGNSVYAVVRSLSPIDFSFQFGKLKLDEISSKITCMIYDKYLYGDSRDYSYMIIGCENGDIFVYYCPAEPTRLTLVSRFNAGGRVVAIKQLGANRPNVDAY